jgi:hypothetical protein
MTEVTSAPAGGEGEVAPIISNIPASDAPETFTTNQAAKALAELRWKRAKESPAESAEVATAEPELAQANAESPQGTASEDQANEPAKPAIEPPKSWTKDLHEHWASLDPVLQERIVARDREDQAAIKRAFNEAADQRKAIAAEREAAEKARKEYEAKLPTLMQTLQEAGPFGDIRSMADVEKLQQEDPFRFQAFQLHQWKLQAAQAEQTEVKSRQEQERQSKRAAYEAEQNAALIELVPEMADPKKANELRTRAVAMLVDDLGLKNDLLGRWMADDTGHEILSNAGIQKLIADGLKYRDIQNAPKAVAKPDLPPVLRPGTAKPIGNAASERVQALDNKLNNSGSLKDAQALLLAKRNAQRRAS